MRHEMRKSALVLMALMGGVTVAAQERVEETKMVQKEPVWKNWFVQMGGDMTLQNPYGYPFGDTFKEGCSLGVDMALGRWFTPEIGLRAKLNWENGLIDTKANWLAPFYQPGENHRKGGYVCLVGDILLDVHNIVGGYDPSRRWNTQLFLRAGGVYNKGVDKGSPLIGLGWGNTFRLGDRWGLYADAAYNGVSSGFAMDPSVNTGVGTGSNMFFTFDVGVTYRLGEPCYRQGETAARRPVSKGGSFWRGWFLQAGADMTLYNPCEKPFEEVFPKGKTMGIDLGVGRWFSPSIGLRGRLNLENNLLKNGHLEWLPYDKEQHKSNYEGGGCMLLTMDMMLSAKHILLGAVPEERWNSYVFGRMGLGSNRSIESMSPVVGIGIGGTYRFSERWSLYAETAFEGITSEYFSGVSWSGATGGKFNGIWDFNLGVQLDL